MKYKVFDFNAMSKDDTIELEKIAKRERVDFLSSIDQLSNKHKDDIFWWLTSFATRSDQSYVYEEICKVLFLKEKVDNGLQVDLIVTDSQSLAKTIQKNIKNIFGDRKVKIKVGTLDKKPKWICWFAYTIYWFRKLYKFLCIKKIMHKEEIPNFSSSKLIDTYILSSLIDDTKYLDRYYTNILNVTKEKIIFTVSLPVLNSKQTYKKFIQQIKCINKSEETNYYFFVKESLLNFWELFPMYCFSYKNLLWTREKFYYKGYDMSSIKNRSLLTECISENSMAGYIAYRFIKKLYDKGYKISNYHMWYEGQPSNYGLQFGLNKYYPESITIGDIGIPLGEYSMSFYPSDLEMKYGITPKYIGLIGNIFFEEFQKVSSSQKLLKIPAFRWSNIPKSDSIYNIKGLEKQRILLVLGMDKELSSNMLREFFKCEKYLENYEIIIKNHPVHKDFTLLDYGVEASIEYSFYDGNMNEVLKSVNIVFIIGTSSGLEILAQRKYLILFCIKGRLNQSSIPDSLLRENRYKKVYDRFDIIEVLKEIKIEDSIGVDVKECFEPVNHETVSHYLEVDD